MSQMRERRGTKEFYQQSFCLSVCLARCFAWSVSLVQEKRPCRNQLSVQS